MLKVIIFSYYFPPGNFAGSYRIEAWANQLNDYNIHPIIITRHWNKNETDYTGISRNKKKENSTNQNYTLIQLPFRGSIRDRLVAKYGGSAKSIGKLFSFWQLLFQNFRINSSPQNNMYFEAKEILSQNPDIELIIASGKPFILFKYCYELKKEFPKINWIADYRDPWNSEIKDHTLKDRLLRAFDSNFEKKWLKSASHITTVSEGIANGIKSFLEFEKPSTIIKNGFNEYINGNDEISTDLFEIGYIGSLYSEQKIEVFIEGFKLFIREFQSKNIILKFHGLGDQPDQTFRIEQQLKNHEDNYQITSRFPKSEMIEIVKNSSCFLICGLPDRKGTYTSKFMDYLALKKPIILCPSDFDVLESAIQNTKTGYILNSKETVYSTLKTLYSEWSQNGFLKMKGNRDIIDSYKNKNQVSKLATLIREVSNIN